MDDEVLKLFHFGGQNFSSEGGIVRSNEGKNYSTWNKAKFVPRLNVPLMYIYFCRFTILWFLRMTGTLLYWTLLWLYTCLSVCQ